MIKKLFSLLIGTIILVSCSNSSSSKVVDETVVADTIIYDLPMKVYNEMDSWEVQRLKGLNRKKLVDQLFEAVYAGKLVAIDYHTQKPKTIEEIKALEASDGNFRERVTNIQFRESWSFDANTAQFTKKVSAIVLGYEVWYGEEIPRYKAAFMVKF